MRTLIFISTLLLTSCAVGPNFRSPEVVIPVDYSNAIDTSSIGNLSHWWRAFDNDQLDSLEDLALANNKNLAVAVQNIEIARLRIASARSEALPSLTLSGDAGAKYDYQTKTVQSYSLMPTVSWDIDLWGKVRRQVEAEKANFRATGYQTAAVLQTLTSQVATTYFSALSYRDALIIAQNTYDSRFKSNILMDSMYFYGAISEVDLAQSRASLATAGATVEQYKRALEQTTLALNLLLGQNPQPIDLQASKSIELVISVGLPSSLLERRPDVMASYYAVQQANAMVGVAVANRLPSISITGQGGLATSIVNDLATARPLAWSGAAALIAPILNWGTLRRAEKTARIQAEQAVLGYEQAVLTAINDVEQALVAIDTYGRELEESARMVRSSDKAAQLTRELYRSGSASYLDVLDADRTLLSSQLQYSQTVNNRYASYIALYKALGGGSEF